MWLAGRDYHLPRTRISKADLAGAKGFSLLELLIVVALMGLLTALVGPVVTNNLTKVRLKTAAQRTVAIFRYAHSQAVSLKRPFWVIIDREEKLLAVLDRWEEQGADETAVSPKAEGTGPSALKVYAYPKDLEIEKLVVGEKEISLRRASFAFYPNGTCSGGEIFLRADDHPGYCVKLDFITGTAQILIDEGKTGPS